MRSRKRERVASGAGSAEARGAVVSPEEAETAEATEEGVVVQMVG